MAEVELRIDTLDQLIASAERDVSRGLFIASFRAIMALEEYMIKNNDYIDDVDGRLHEALINGTIDGQNMVLMDDSTVPDWIASISDEAGKMNVVMNMTIFEVVIGQRDPWHVYVAVNFSMTLNDSSGLASWQRISAAEALVPIEGFEDPLFIRNGLGRITNLINKTPYEGNFTYHDGSDWNMSNLIDHIESSLYAENTDAPSFLKRLEGDLSASEHGIECMVNLKKLSDQAIDINSTASIIDHEYWQDGADGDYRINRTDDWVVIDAAHRAKYNVTALSYMP